MLRGNSATQQTKDVHKTRLKTLCKKRLYVPAQKRGNWREEDCKSEPRVQVISGKALCVKYVCFMCPSNQPLMMCSPRGTARSGPVDIPYVASWLSSIHLINSFVASSKSIAKHPTEKKTTTNRRWQPQIRAMVAIFAVISSRPYLL